MNFDNMLNNRERLGGSIGICHFEQSRCMTIAPLAYIMRWRMEVARQELVSSSATIIQIALSVGYNSEAAFSRVFKRFYNKAPATYRREKMMSQ